MGHLSGTKKGRKSVLSAASKAEFLCLWFWRLCQCFTKCGAVYRFLNISLKTLHDIVETDIASPLFQSPQ